MRISALPDNLKILRTALTAASLLSLLGAPAPAMLAVRPSRVEFMVPPGARKQFHISISNSSKEAAACSVSIRNFAMDPSGLPHGSLDTQARSLAPWLTVAPVKFVLGGGATREVKFTVAVPRDARGGYYATIEVSGAPTSKPTSPQGGASIQFSFQSNVIVMGVVDGRGLRPELVLRSIELTNSELASGGIGSISLRAFVENTGTVHTIVQCSAEIRSTEGTVFWKGPLRGGKGTLIPGFPRLFSSSGISGLRDGRYIASVEFIAPTQRLVMRGAQGLAVVRGKATVADGSGPLWATNKGLVIAPSATVFSGPAKARRSAVVSLTNNLDKSVSCRLSVSPWRVMEDGMMGPCPPKEARSSAAGWVSVKPEFVDLAPGATKRIQVTASIPEGVRGEHYAGILVTPSAKDAAGILPPSVMVTVTPDKTQELGLVVKSARVEAAATGGYQLTVKAQNTGNVRLLPEVQCEVLDAKELRVGDLITLPGDGNALFPGVIGTWTTVSTRVLAPGKYKLKVIANTEKGKPGTGLTVPFSIPLGTIKAPATKKPAAQTPIAKPKVPGKKAVGSR